MATGIQISLQNYGAHLYGEVPAPLRIEIMDTNFKVHGTRLADTTSSFDFQVPSGTYLVTATAPSGSHVKQMVNVPENEIVPCSLPLHDLSPHENHEWAYLTHKLEFPAPRGLSSRRKQSREGLQGEEFNRAWLRVWRREGAKFGSLPNIRNRLRAHSINSDGNVYLADFDTDEAWCLQVGGPQIAWKCVALPPSSSIKMLIRPSTWRGSHPLQIVVSSDNLVLEGLLAFLQRGEVGEAQQLAESQQELAERFLQSKRKDETAAAIGGYYLLRIQAFDRLHDWANNLANWFQWMSDGSIIHAWQLISEYRRRGTNSSELLDQARDRLLEAVERGFPIYTEGLRLLRDGLLLIERRSGNDDPGVQAAVERVGQYFAAADWTSSTTTFIGETPDSPSPVPRFGEPKLDEGLEFIDRNL